MITEDMRDELMQDSRHEELMSKDYDYFLEHQDSLFTSVRTDIEILIKAFKHNGWEHDINTIIDEIKERL